MTRGPFSPAVAVRVVPEPVASAVLPPGGPLAISEVHGPGQTADIAPFQFGGLKKPASVIPLASEDSKAGGLAHSGHRPDRDTWWEGACQARVR